MTQPKKTQCSKIKKKPLKCRQNNIEDWPIQGNQHRATTKIHIWKLTLHFFQLQSTLLPRKMKKNGKRFHSSLKYKGLEEREGKLR